MKINSILFTLFLLFCALSGLAGAAKEKGTMVAYYALCTIGKWQHV